MTELTSPINRTIHVPEIDSPVVVEIDSAGVKFRIAGQQKRIGISWTEAIQASRTPMNVPAFLEGKPLEFLKYAARKTKGSGEKEGQ